MTSSKRICAYCNKPITEHLVMALGRCWHKEHFLCFHCKQVLKNAKYIEENGKPYCEADWKALFQSPQLPKCANCNLPIQGAAINALGKTWHKEHFVCAHCQKPFQDGKYIKENDKPYCEADHQKLFRGVQGRPQTSGAQGPPPTLGAQGPPPTSGVQARPQTSVPHGPPQTPGVQGRPQTSVPYGPPVPHGPPMPHGPPPPSAAQGHHHTSVAHGPPPPSAAHGHHHTSGAHGNTICAGCNKPIAGVTTALGKIWHIDHFVCTHCKKPLQESGCRMNDGKPYCENDYNALFRKKCSACGEWIDGPVLNVLEKPWHDTCFTCSKCRKTINPRAGFTERDGKPFCFKCGHCTA